MICSHCKKQKNTIEMGNSTWCKSCNAEYARNRRKDNEEVRLKDIENSRRWYRENKEYAIEYAKKNKNPEKVKEINKKWYKENKWYHKLLVKRWRKSNPEKAILHTQNRRALLRGDSGVVTKKEWIDLVNFYGGKCLCCGRNDLPLTMDHVVPIISGGRNIIENIQPLCKSCNSSKHKKTKDYRK